MLVHFCPLSLLTQFVSVHSLRLYVPLISGGQTLKHETLTQCWDNVGPRR